MEEFAEIQSTGNSTQKELAEFRFYYQAGVCEK
jgi:hypothetical protein